VIGAPGRAPCGHRGEHLTTNYVRCVEGCEDLSSGVPRTAKDSTTRPICSHCGSGDVLVYRGFTVEGMDLWHCKGCLKSFKVKTRAN
jgi:hypothetical protein